MDSIGDPVCSGGPPSGIFVDSMHTQVGIIGAGPAGLLLAQLLHLEGIDSVILENRSEDYVIERVRAGVLEQGTVDLMRSLGVASRLDREGLRHEGIYLSFEGIRHRIDMAGLTSGRAITVYGQHEVVKDLIAARRTTGRPLHFECDAVAIHDFDSPTPRITYIHGGASHELTCDYIAGCDGFHGICRPTVPEGVLTFYDRNYPYGWLGILAEAAPSSDELVYSTTDRGFALFSMRSPTVTRLYLQCAPDEDINDWSDDRIWDEMLRRMSTKDGWKPTVGPIFQKGVTGMRSFVTEPMQYGRLYLAGDAAHIVPPTGAKGLNLAAADVFHLAQGIAEFYRTGRQGLLDSYSDTCLRRIWRAQRFSWWMTVMLHKLDDPDPRAAAFDRKRQLAELEYLCSSTAAMTSLSENYVGLPIE
jgi:p-hydroxybenzoate 3-monooxygenase